MTIRKVESILVGCTLLSSLPIASNAQSLLVPHSKKIVRITGEKSASSLIRFPYCWLTNTKVILWDTAKRRGSIVDIMTSKRTEVSLEQPQYRKAFEAWSNEFRQKIQWHRWGLYPHRKSPASSRGTPPYPLSVWPPKDSYIEQATFSPDRTQIAWVLDFRLKKVPMLPSQNRGSAGMMSLSDHTWSIAREIWVSRADGKGMRSLGRVQTYVQSADGNPPELGLEWLPHGKAISFVYNKMIYLYK